MNTSRVFSWGRWGHPGVVRAGAVTPGVMILGTLWAGRNFVPSVPRPNMRRGLTQASLLLAAPTVPTPITTICKKTCSYQRATNDPKSWS